VALILLTQFKKSLVLIKKANSMFKRLTAIVLLLACCFQANASLLTYNGYTLDTDTNIVSDGTTQWLQWDETSGMSIDQALTQYSSDGWTLASNQQMSDLFNGFGFGNPDFNALEDGEQQRSGLTASIYSQFVELFGVVSMFIDQCATSNAVFCLGGGNASGTSALFGSDLDGDDNYKAAIVMLNGQGQSFDPNGRVIQTGGAQINNAILTDDVYSNLSTPVLLSGGIFQGSAGGIALVKTQVVNPPNNVPAPGLILLFCAGILSILFKKHSHH